MNKVEVFKEGLMDGLKTTWELAKVIVPVYFIITFLKYSPVLDWMIAVFEPITALVGLPGEAAMPIVLANALTVYPAIPAIEAFSFSSKEITVVSAMVLICHSLPVETMIARKAGAKGWVIIILRIFLCLLAGVVLNISMGD